jgi:hypothetical protein
MQFLSHSCFVKAASDGWCLRKWGDSDGTAADIGDQDDSPASAFFDFYDEYDTRDCFPTSPTPIYSYGPAGKAGCHNSLDGS